MVLGLHLYPQPESARFPYEPRERHKTKVEYKLNYRSHLTKAWHRFIFINYPNVSILRGNYCQSSKRFRSRTNGRQDAANCTVAVLFAKIFRMSDWNANYVDKILSIGDELLTISITLRPNLRFEMAKLKDLYNNVYIDNIKITFTTEGSVVDGKIFSDFAVTGVPDLKIALENYLGQNDAVILNIMTMYVAFWKKEGYFYYFDPHERDENGLAVHFQNGKACVMRFSSCADMVEAFCCNIDRTKNFNFQLLPINILRMSKVRIEPPPLPTRSPLNPHEGEPDEIIEPVQILKDVEPPKPPPPPPFNPESPFSEYYEMSPDYVKKSSQLQLTEDQKKIIEKMIETKTSVSKLPIELKPELVPSKTYFKATSSNSGILRGSAFKRSEMAPSIALYSIGMLKQYKSRVWTEDIINKILHDGHKLYKQSFYRQGSGGDAHVLLKDVCKSFEVLGKKFTAHINHSAVIGILNTLQPNVADLATGMMDFFREFDSGVIQGPLTVAIWQEDGLYYMFDPCERDEQGSVMKPTNGGDEEKKSGKACVTWHKLIGDLNKLYCSNLTMEQKFDPFFISSVLITDFIDVPEPWYQFVGIKPGKWILRGTFSQNNQRFAEDNRNCQSTACSAIAIAFAFLLYQMEDWSTDIIDNVLMEGDEYYTTTVHQLNETNKFVHPHLLAHELLPNYTLCSVSGKHSGKRFNFDIRECMVNGLISARDNETPLNLKRGFIEFFKEFNSGIVASGNISIGVWKTNNCYYYFDSHTRDPKGLSHPIGLACLLRIEQLEELVAAIEANLEPTPEDVFNISACIPTVWETDESGVVKPPLNQYKRVNNQSAILYASHHEGNKRYFDNANKQTFSNCLVATAMMKIVPSGLWSTIILDEILKFGNEIHERAYLKVLENDPAFEGELSLDQCEKTFRLGDYSVVITLKDPITDRYEGDRNVNNIYNTFLKYFQEQENPEEPDLNKCAIFTSQYVTYGIWADLGVMYIFDSKERDPEGHTYERDLWSEKHSIHMAFGEGGEDHLDYPYDEKENMELPTDDEVANETFAEAESEESFTPVIREHPEGQGFCRWFTTLGAFCQHIVDNAPPNHLDETDFTLVPLDVKVKLFDKEKPEQLENVEEPAEVDISYLGPWHHFTQIEYGAWIIRGTHCQQDLRFPDVNQGNQDAAMAFSFFIFQYNLEPKEWQTQLIDAVLKYGDKLHSYCLQKKRKIMVSDGLNNEEINDALQKTLLEPKDVFTELLLGDYTYKITLTHDVTHGNISYQPKEGETAPVMTEGDTGEIVQNLQQALQLVLNTSQTRYFIVHVKRKSFPIYKGEKMLYLFDPNCRGPNGLTATAGVACLLRFMLLDKLVDTIKANLPPIGNNKFYIDTLTIEKFEIQKDSIVGQVKIPELPEKLTAFNTILPGKLIISGTISQEDERFGRGQNVQSGACALVALAMSIIHRTDTWSKEIIDEVIINGDRLYSMSADKLGFQFNPWEESMSIKKCEKEFYIGVNQVVCELIEHCDHQGVLDAKGIDILNLRQGVDKFFANYNTHGVIESPNYSVAIWKDNKFLYMFDPYPRNSTGITFPAGTACLMAFHSPQMLAEHCLSNIPQLNRCDHFAITPVEVHIIKTRTKKLSKPCGATPVPPNLGDPQNECPPKKKLRESKPKKPKKVPKTWVPIQDSDLSILYAGFSQNSKCFSIFSRGNQAAAIAVVGIVMFHLNEPSCWTQDTLNSILTSGDQLYKDSYLRYRPEDRQVGLKQLLRRFFVDKYRVEIIIYRPSIKGAIMNSDVTSGIYNFFLQERAGVFIALNMIVAIFQKGGQYYILDPNDCDLSGNPIKMGGRAVLLRYKDVNDISEKLLNNLGPVDDQDPPIQYFLHAVQIKEIIYID